MRAERIAQVAAPTRPVRGRKRELYRERCEDSDGNSYCVIVWQKFRGLDVTSYTLEDGSPVNYVDGCEFEIAATKTIITRCADPVEESQ